VGGSDGRGAIGSGDGGGRFGFALRDPPGNFRGMSIVPGLVSPYVKTGRLLYVARVLAKIRLHAAGKLPVDEYAANLGGGFDERCCTFLRIDYQELKRRVLEGTGTDEEILAWAEERGGRRSDDECEIWNAFMMKRGFRDAPAVAATLARRIRESGLEDKPILTMFDYIDFDEGRDPVSTRAWEAKG
jgi:gluconokinase